MYIHVYSAFGKGLLLWLPLKTLSDYYAEYDYPFELHKSFAVNHSEGIVGTAFGLLFPIYDDGIAEDVEGLVLSLEVLGLELDPRDVDFVNLPRSAYIIAIYPSGIAIIDCLIPIIPSGITIIILIIECLML